LAPELGARNDSHAEARFGMEQRHRAIKRRVSRALMAPTQAITHHRSNLGPGFT
jgi:hypothetical protein